MGEYVLSEECLRNKNRCGLAIVDGFHLLGEEMYLL